MQPMELVLACWELKGIGLGFVFAGSESIAMRQRQSEVSES
jgi:hypothetical protein